MICARGVTVRAGGRVLVDAIDLAVRGGELVAIVGPNGAGKSTLLGALAGDRRLARGHVELAGCDIARTPIAQLARVRAVLPQTNRLVLAFTALEVVQLAGRGITAARARRHLDEVGLAHLATRSFPTLSGGEQQRVQLARVLAQRACGELGALLLDEPTSALDARHQRLVLERAREVARRGDAVVVVLHDLTLAARWCDRIALLAGGRLVADGAPEDVLAPRPLEAAYATRFEVLRGEGGLVVVPR